MVVFTRRVRETSCDEFAIDLPARLAEVNAMFAEAYRVIGESDLTPDDLEVRMHKHELIVVVKRDVHIKRRGSRDP